MFLNKIPNLLRKNIKILKQFSMDYLKKNPYFNKYSDKIKKLKTNDAKTFEERFRALEEEKKKSALNNVGEQPLDVAKQPSVAAEQSLDIAVQQSNITRHPLENSILSKRDNLNSIVKMDILAPLDGKEISELWKEFHEKKDCIFATLLADDFKIIYEKSLECPNFIYPLPRGGGYEFFVQRWLDRICYFTPLSDFQKFKENASPCISLNHYDDLAASKDIVLMRGFPDVKKISVHEAQLLALQVKMYYGRTSGVRFNLVRWFNNSPTDFQRHMDLVHEFENFKRDVVERREWGSPVDPI